jgi:hypothetical protein
MVTRFRLTDDVTDPAVLPELKIGSATAWTHTPGTTREYRQLLTSDTSALTNTLYSPDAADHLVAGSALHGVFVSDELSSGIAFTNGDTIKYAVQCSEVVSGNNLNVVLIASIFDSAGTTLRRLLVDRAEEPTEIAGAGITNRFDSITQTGATYTTVSGDRLCVAFGAEGTPVGAGGVQGHNGTFRWGGDGAGGDLPENDVATGTTLNPWIEFTPDITFGGAAATSLLTTPNPIRRLLVR